MEINRLLLKPAFQKIGEEFRQIQHRARVHGSRESLALYALIDRKLRQLELTSELLDLTESATHGLQVRNLQDDYRRLKLELRFANRRWDRLVSN